MMPFLWLLLPFAALGIYYGAQKASGGTAADDPLGVVGAVDTVADSITSAAGEIMGTVNETTKKIFALPAGAAPYAAAIDNAEKNYGIPETLLARLLYQESRFRSDIISGKTKSPAGALGIAQFMPATARDFGINPLDPYQSIDAAARYLAQLYKKFGNWESTLAAYNWGQGNVARKGLESAPLETRNYVAQILGDVQT